MSDHGLIHASMAVTNAYVAVERLRATEAKCDYEAAAVMDRMLEQKVDIGDLAIEYAAVVAKGRRATKRIADAEHNLAESLVWLRESV